MQPKDTRYAREWLVVAEKDRERVTRALREDEATSHDATLNRIRLVCHDISLFYLDSRYPATLTGGWSEHDVRDSLRDIEGLIDQIREALKT